MTIGMETKRPLAQNAQASGATSWTAVYQSRSATITSFGIVTIAHGKGPPMLTQRHLEILEARGLDAEMLARHGVENLGVRGDEA